MGGSLGSCHLLDRRRRRQLSVGRRRLAVFLLNGFMWERNSKEMTRFGQMKGTAYCLLSLISNPESCVICVVVGTGR